MADIADIDQTIFQAAAAHLPPGTLVRVESQSYLNSVNEEGIEVTIVLTEDTPEHLGGDVALDTIHEIFSRLQLAGDERVPMVIFATEDELAHRDDPDE